MNIRADIERIARGLAAHPVLRHDWAIRRCERRAIERALALFARGRLADVGCGSKPYRRFLQPIVDEHIGIDRPDSPHGTDHVDVIGSAYETGLMASSMDTVLMSQVFEHLEDPDAGLNEAHRILRPGGHLILSTNFAWHLHEEPRDYFRYTKYGLEHLIAKAGLELVEIRSMAGTWLTILEEVAYGLRRAAHRRRVLLVLAVPMGHLCQLSGVMLDRLSYDETLTSGYLVVARKPDAPFQLGPSPGPAVGTAMPNHGRNTSLSW